MSWMDVAAVAAGVGIFLLGYWTGKRHERKRWRPKFYINGLINRDVQ